jgi:hypothetical protein
VQLLLAFIWWLAVMCGLELRADAPVAEYPQKAKFIATLPDYVKWPNSDGSPVTVGILGDDSFEGALDNTRLTIKRSKRAQDLKDCQIIFIAKSEQDNLSAILADLEGKNILTVGESEGFAKQGGVIGLVMDGGKVSSEINTGAARRAGLLIDFRFLRLARRVFSS